MDISFTKVSLPFGWLGNMSPHAIEFGGKTWRTAEALFQALRFSDTEIQEEIRANKSPMGAKMVAKKHAESMVIDPQSEADIQNMRLVIRRKLKQHPDLRAALLATNTAQIIEDCTKRQRGSGLFWGAARQEDGTWKGENTLGKLWMELREEFQGNAIWHDVIL